MDAGNIGRSWNLQEAGDVLPARGNCQALVWIRCGRRFRLKKEKRPLSWNGRQPHVVISYWPLVAQVRKGQITARES
jgi:hypothetical protein